ncbi:MAG: lytic murein transglycosylase [Deltaproteobacteria bacterium]|nr:lytic murein transglycosylase [Candidatus Anaeroferrophillacea bacterium]
MKLSGHVPYAAVLLPLALLLFIAASVPVRAENAPVAKLAARLQQEPELDPAVVDRLFGPVVSVNIELIAKNLKQVEYKASYDRFLEPGRLDRARNFLDRHGDWLARLERNSPVPRELVAAIFLVESHVGEYRGTWPLLEVFTSLAVCNREPFFQETYRLLRKTYPDLDRDWLRRRADRKADWAYGQLRALLAMHGVIDVDEVKGSWAGAFGVPQFIPSSYHRYGMDGNGDGRIDLYDFTDAAASVMHYLEAHGWRRDLPRERQEDVLYAYNHSRLYCRTILAIRDALSRP